MNSHLTAPFMKWV